MKEPLETTPLLNAPREGESFALLKLPKVIIKHTFSFFTAQELSRIARANKCCKEIAYDCLVSVEELQTNEVKRIKYGELTKHRETVQFLEKNRKTKASFNDLNVRGGYVSPLFGSFAFGLMGMALGTMFGTFGGSTLALVLGYAGGGCCCVTSICLCKKVHTNQKDIENIDAKMPLKLEMR